LQKYSLIFIGILILLLMGLFTVRNTLLNYALEKRTNVYSHKLGAGISWSKASFSGISTVNIFDLTLLPPNNDTLISVKKVSVRIKPFDLLRLRLRFDNAELIQPSINLKRNGDQSNYLFLLDRKSGDSLDQKPDQTAEKDYAGRVDNLFNAFFSYIPATVKIENFTVKAAIENHRFSFGFPELRITDDRFNTLVNVTDDSLTMRWRLSGILNPALKKAAISIKKTDSLNVIIPYIRQRWHTLIAFDSASIQLNYHATNVETSHIEGLAVVYKPILNHERISPNNVKLERSELTYRLNFGKTYIEVDSSTLVSFNRMSFNPYLKYETKPNEALTISIHKPEFGAQDFFTSLPEGLFTNFEGIKVSGKLGFHLDFHYDFKQPDSILFSSGLTSKGFSVQQFGKTNFAFINEPFLYTAYEKGQPVRQFMVGPENPDFRTLEQIPLHLRYAIMTSEDGQFYFHNGFIPDAIRESIITNIKERRFARGGSTISMQLVKNVYLNRNKNITRKIEEMLITWLIESQRMASKERMFEIYLNIIETGPMVYGVNEAARFYFDKEVSKLTLAESIYLASIIPRPKLFRYSFDNEGKLREYLQSYYSLVSGKMLKKEWITQEEFDHLKPEIELKGPAREMILPADSIPAFDEIEIDIPDIQF